MQTLVERYLDEIKGVISCYDRLIITGTLPQICFAEGMTTWLYTHNIRIFDYAKFAEGLKQKIRENAERLASENGIEIDFLKKQAERKEDRVKKVLERRGSHPGLVHIISVKLLTRRFSNPTLLNVCIIIFILLMKRLVFVTYACRPGAHSGYSSILMATIGCPVNSPQKASNLPL